MGVNLIYVTLYQFIAYVNEGLTKRVKCDIIRYRTLKIKYKRRFFKMKKKKIMKLGCYLVIIFFVSTFAFSLAAFGYGEYVGKEPPAEQKLSEAEEEGPCIDKLFNGEDMKDCTKNETRLVIDSKE